MRIDCKWNLFLPCSHALDLTRAKGLIFSIYFKNSSVIVTCATLESTSQIQILCLKVESTNTSQLDIRFVLYRLFIMGKFDVYLLRHFNEKLICV